MNQPNLPTTIRHKYIAHLRAITAFNDDQRITLDAVDFALACALADLNECWADEHASLQQRTIRLQNELISARELEQRLQAGLNQTMLENDVLEAECNRLKQMIMISASSAPTTATTAPSAPAASTTSKPPAPTPPSPAASTTASADPAAPASSATTSPRPRGRPSTPKSPLPSAESAGPANPPTRTEVGDTTGLDPIDWMEELHGLLTMYELSELSVGNMHWRDLDKATQEAVILRISEAIHRHLGTISQTLYQRYMPPWATTVGSWRKTCNLTWIQVLQHLNVTPSSRP